MPLALATVALGACSSDDATTTDGGSNGTYINGGYMSLSINLPSTSTGLRAANDNFNDGLASEYEVKDATLILFSGASESAATFHSAYDLTTSMAMDGSNTNQITSTTEIVKKVNDPEAGTNLYALVVLNNNGLLAVEENAGLKVGTTTFSSTSTFSDFQNTIVGAEAGVNGVSAFNTNGFYMTNAPLSSAQGGATTAAPAGTVTTLATVTNNVYSTETEAQASPAAEIFVERGVAKVTMTDPAPGNLSGSEYSATGSNGEAVAYAVQGWTLDILSHDSYLVRHYNTGWDAYASAYLTPTNYRFIGNEAIVSNSGATSSSAVNYYRTYWATSPSVTAVSDYYNVPVSGLASLSTAFGDNNPQYCFENTTTSVSAMNQDAVTRVIISAQIGNGSTFYIINNDKSILYTSDKLTARVKQAVLNNASVIAWINGLQSGATVDANSISGITYSDRDANTGYITVTGFTVTSTNAQGETVTYVASSEQNSTVVTAINTDIKTITEYTGGIAYYAAYIKHFGDELTPWNTDTNTDITTTTTYPGGDVNFLGRYGVLRNNWYDLNVTGIRALGDAVVPERSSVPVDELDSYIAISINVLSWAKRSQNVEL